MESIHEANTVLLDKTGTITRGESTLTDLITLEDQDDKEILQLIASLEDRSEHTVAQAIVRKAQEYQGLSLAPASDFESVTGQGVHGLVNQHQIAIGNEQLMKSLNLSVASFKDQAQSLSSQGKRSCTFPLTKNW